MYEVHLQSIRLIMEYHYRYVASWRHLMPYTFQLLWFYKVLWQHNDELHVSLQDYHPVVLLFRLDDGLF